MDQTTSSKGSLIATILVVAIIVVGALYFWSERGGDALEAQQLESINTQSDSDATLDIEADLEATDVDSVDYDLDESNFNAS